MDVYRQGDVIIRSAKFPGKGIKKDDLVLAEGEATGHRHRVTRGQAELFQLAAGLMFLRVLSEYATIGHEEHGDIILPMGEYKVNTQREWDWYSEEVKRVQD